MLAISEKIQSSMTAELAAREKRIAKYVAKYQK